MKFNGLRLYPSDEMSLDGEFSPTSLLRRQSLHHRQNSCQADHHHGQLYLCPDEPGLFPRRHTLVSRCSRVFVRYARYERFVDHSPSMAANAAVCSLIYLRADYCNCLLAGLPAYSFDRLQSNATAHLVCGLCKFDHATRPTVLAANATRVTYKL